jgi:hypothetical protein
VIVAKEPFSHLVALVRVLQRFLVLAYFFKRLGQIAQTVRY